jgi:hypothetical protein
MRTNAWIQAEEDVMETEDVLIAAAHRAETGDPR